MGKAVLLSAVVLLAGGCWPGARAASLATNHPPSQAEQDLTALILAAPPRPDPEPDMTAFEKLLPLRRAIFARVKGSENHRELKPPALDGKFNPVDEAFYLAGQGGEALENAMTDLLDSKTSKMYFESEYMVDLRFHGARSPGQRTSWGVEMKLPERRLGFDFKVKF